MSQYQIREDDAETRYFSSRGEKYFRFYNWCGQYYRKYLSIEKKMSRYSCTNQRYEFTPLWVEIIDILPKGTRLYRPVTSQSSPGDPTIFTLDPDIFPRVEVYLLEKDLPYIVGLPEGNPVEGLCWECQPDEEVCFAENLDVEIPHPCAWWQEPYFYICQFDCLRRLG